MCIGCRNKKKKEEMIRFTLTTEGVAMLSQGRRRDGRGIYICPSGSCLRAARKRYRFEPSVHIDPFWGGPGMKISTGQEG
jgi:predicted RNA-binding protein YlxR (DUF448 family)